ncbi:hypothetical protein N748_10720 [Legionella pneumophila str. 121004]|nr:hypothetical protein N748_10720 [Legionella pneumophila str. 121004]
MIVMNSIAVVFVQVLVRFNGKYIVLDDGGEDEFFKQ